MDSLDLVEPDQQGGVLDLAQVPDDRTVAMHRARVAAEVVQGEPIERVGTGSRTTIQDVAVLLTSAQ